MLQTAVEAARRAGQLIAEQYPTHRSVSYKGYRDLVTETNVAAEETTLNLIRERFPDHATRRNATRSFPNSSASHRSVTRYARWVQQRWA